MSLMLVALLAIPIFSEARIYQDVLKIGNEGSQLELSRCDAYQDVCVRIGLVDLDRLKSSLKEVESLSPQAFASFDLMTAEEIKAQTERVRHPHLRKATTAVAIGL